MGNDNLDVSKLTDTSKNMDGSAILAGAQQPLSADVANGRTKGGDFNQNQMANALGRGADTTVNVNIRPVDRKTLEGSTPGDHRAQAADAKLPANPGPREPKGQTPNGRNCRS
jgi:hypothetical protein